MSSSNNLTPEGVILCELIVLFVIPVIFRAVWNNILVDLCSFNMMSYWQSFWVCWIGRMAFSSKRLSD